MPGTWCNPKTLSRRFRHSLPYVEPSGLSNAGSRGLNRFLEPNRNLGLLLKRSLLQAVAKQSRRLALATPQHIGYRCADFSQCVGALCRKENQGNFGGSTNASQKFVAPLPAFPGMRLIIEFNHADGFEVIRAAQDKIKVFRADLVEGFLP